MAQYPLQSQDSELQTGKSDLSNQQAEPSSEAAVQKSAAYVLSSRDVWLITLTAVQQVGCAIVLVTVGALLVGLWLDAQLHTRPVIALCLVIGSFPVSMLLVWRLTMAIIRRIARQSQSKAD